MKTLILLLLVTCSSCLSESEEYYEKQLEFPVNATLEQKVEMASRLIPTRQQLEWQQMEMTAFLHFGINTFTGNECGSGKEDPNLFNPTALDCEQWVRSLKEAGFKMALITAKHHDGFCLWPTLTTKHSVASSSWKNGKGDVVRELRNACAKYGMKFGIYLSPWDRNASCYGDSAQYNKLFIQQLTELLTQYGEVNQVWLDGVNREGPNGNKQIYDWKSIFETIEKLQPNAVTSIMGSGSRWVGNEDGMARTTEWSATVKVPVSSPGCGTELDRLGIGDTFADLGNREILSKAKALYWYPSEVDVSIRPGWFYHAFEDKQVRSLANLVDIYFSSVGRNSVLLLSIPPDTRGLLNENDVRRLKEFSDYIQESFKYNTVCKSDEAWNTSSDNKREYQIIEGSALVNTFLVQEDIAKGQRIEKFSVEIFSKGRWHNVFNGTTIGYKRLKRFPAIKAERLRITVTSSRGVANISNVGLFYSEPLGSDNKLSEGYQVQYPFDPDLRPEKRRGPICEVERLMAQGKQIPFIVDMGTSTEMSAICGSASSHLYKVYISNDACKWSLCNVLYNRLDKETFMDDENHDTKYIARYLKFEPITEINGKRLAYNKNVGVLVNLR